MGTKGISARLACLVIASGFLVPAAGGGSCSALDSVTRAAAPLVANGDFEQGLTGWSTAHDWYAKPAGGGLSKMEVVAGEGCDGGKALRFTGEGKRGIAMQVFPAYPGRYRVAGWLKCQGLDAGEGEILAEWLDGQNKWMRGDRVGQVRNAATICLVRTVVVYCRAKGDFRWQWLRGRVQPPCRLHGGRCS